MCSTSRWVHVSYVAHMSVVSLHAQSPTDRAACVNAAMCNAIHTPKRFGLSGAFFPPLIIFTAASPPLCQRVCMLNRDISRQAMPTLVPK